MIGRGINITGCGLVTPLGDSVEATWRRLLAGEAIVTHSPAALENRGEMPRVTQLAVRAAREALENAKWAAGALTDDRIGLFVGTSRGPVNDWLPAQRVSPAMGVHQVAAGVAHQIKMGVGPRMTFSAACASGLHALIRACLMLRSGEIDRAMVIGAEASLHPMFLACFRRLGVLAREGAGCRPFDVHRGGFVVSEAAAAVCLERAEATLPCVAIDRFAIGSDAVTITAGDATGQVLRRMLRHVTDSRGVDLIHAHGTGTITNDPIELAAIEDECVVGANRPTVYSHKGALGHSLGASGMVSLVLNCRMHGERIVPANVRTTLPLPSRQVAISRSPSHLPIRRSICMAAGFGGSIAAVSLSGEM